VNSALNIAKNNVNGKSFQHRKMTEKEIIATGLTGEIAALEIGATDGIPILTLHGWLDNAASFKPLAQCLEKYRWISIDMPGHGKSAHRPPGCIYHFTDYVADLRCVIKSLGIGQHHLVGHSLGAGVAAMYAAAFPEYVNLLVLLDGIGPIARDDDDSLDQFVKSMAFLDEPSLSNAQGYHSWENLIEARMRAGRINSESAEQLLRRGADWDDDRLVVQSDKRLKQHSPIYMNQDKVVAILSGIEAPTLLVLAADGLVINRKTTARRIQAIPNLTTVSVDGFHHVHMDSPELVAAEIDRFMARENDDSQ
jgi:pimeloyl-ACP methyl ester carboxylesterase